MDRNNKISIMVEADSNEGEDDSTQFNLVKHLKCQYSKWQARIYSTSPVVESRMPNAITIAGMVIFIGNVIGTTVVQQRSRTESWTWNHQRMKRRTQRKT